MSSVIKLPLRSLSEEVVQELKEKYPDAEISIELHQDRNKTPLSEKRFWEIIALLDWTKEGDDDLIVEPAVSHLAEGPIRHIFEFADILSEKLYALDAKKYAKHIGEDAWDADSYFSVDNFLYARCCVVANGKELYHQVLENPETMPKDLTFEALLYIPSDAFERKTEKDYDYIPAFNFETYSNEEGWAD